MSGPSLLVTPDHTVSDELLAAFREKIEKLISEASETKQGERTFHVLPDRAVTPSTVKPGDPFNKDGRGGLRNGFGEDPELKRRWYGAP